MATTKILPKTTTVTTTTTTTTITSAEITTIYIPFTCSLVGTELVLGAVTPNVKQGTDKRWSVEVGTQDNTVLQVRDPDINGTPALLTATASFNQGVKVEWHRIEGGIESPVYPEAGPVALELTITAAPVTPRTTSITIIRKGGKPDPTQNG